MIYSKAFIEKVCEETRSERFIGLEGEAMVPALGSRPVVSLMGRWMLGTDRKRYQWIRTKLTPPTKFNATT
jgi:hypothetical protein